MINPTPAKIEDILNSSVKFTVPAYQRDYTWGKDEATEFYEDLKSYVDIDGSGRLFLGTLIFHNSSDENLVKVVDGQQRITTILIFLVACRTVAKKINETNLAMKIHEKIAFTDSTTAESLGCRLEASDTIKDVFEYMALNFDWDETFPPKIKVKGKNKPVKRQVNKIKPIYKFFYDNINNIDQRTLSKYLRELYNSYVVKIDIESEEEAFSIFERTNARGVDLEASDLLKNYLFKNKVEGMDEIWPQIIDNSDGTLLRMLKYFYVANNGYVTKSVLYRRLKSYGDNMGAKNLVSEINKFSGFYYMIRNTNEKGTKDYFDGIGCDSISKDQDYYEQIYYAIEGLRLFKIVQVYPLLYAAITSFVRGGGGKTKTTSKKLISMFEKIERYHFINTAICNRMGNEVEKLYAAYCTKYGKNEFEPTTRELFDELNEKLATEREFIASYSEILYAADSIPLIVYIFDRMNNFKLAPGQRLRLYNPDPKLIRKNHNIEHVYPQKPNEELIRKYTIDSTDNIGNLLVISFKTNSSLGNKSPEEKFKLLQGKQAKQIQNSEYVKEFVKKYSNKASRWDDEVIANRAEDDAKFAYNNVWSFR
jgi:Ca2+-binding EF-hand superfamily protein